MQAPDSNSRTAGAVNHPDATAWMAFLYGEVPAATQQELEAHLGQCAVCAAQVKQWREGMNALDTWKIPTRKPARRSFVPVMKWAAAAAVVLLIGIFLGRQTSRDGAEMAKLRNSVAQLTARVEQQGQSTLTNSVAAANEETLRLLADFSRQQDARRVADREAVALKFRTLDTRMEQLSTELETVALNTQTGFEETHQVLASFVPHSDKTTN